MEPEERDILVSWFLSDKGKEDFYEVLQEDSEQVQEDGNLNYNTLLQKIHDKIDPIPGRPEKKGIRKYLWPVASTAAVLLMLMSFGRYFFTLTDTPQEEMTAEEIAGKTGVAGEILSGKVQRGLNASEFLAICSYLKVDPYDFYDRSSEEWRKGC